jgi:hypothetical protein
VIDEHDVAVFFVDLGEEKVASVGGDGQTGSEVLFNTKNLTGLFCGEIIEEQ